MIKRVVSTKKSFINMTGNKSKIAAQIFSVLPNDCSNLHYIEPFFGSGAAYCNLPRRFRDYALFDCFPFVINFINSEFSAEQLSFIYDKITSNWNLTIKDDYYNFRTWWNKQYTLLSASNAIVCAIFFILNSACINSMTRFGPEGFNQAYGNRIIQKSDFCALPELIKPHSIFRVVDFRSFDWNSLDNFSFVYLDPPYSETRAMKEMIGFYKWGRAEDDDLYNKIYTSKCSFILSTTNESWLANKLESTVSSLSKKIIEKKYKVSPGKSLAQKYQEIILYKFVQ